MVLAVHLSDGVVAGPWVFGGWAALAVIVFVSTWRIRDDEIPRIGVLTAAFFVASQVHLPLGVVSVHLLLNGLVGVILRWRTGLAITIGLTLQALLFGHGGYTTLGLNIVGYTIPSFAAGVLFHPARSLLESLPSVRVVVMFTATCFFLATGVGAAQWLWVHVYDEDLPMEFASHWVAEPLVATGLIGASALAGVAEMRLKPGRVFPLGVLLGGLTAYVTVLLNCGIIWLGGRDEVRAVAPVLLLAHLPVVVVEAVAVGFVVSFLSRVKPEWLGIEPASAAQRPTGSGKTSSNGTSH